MARPKARRKPRPADPKRRDIATPEFAAACRAELIRRMDRLRDILDEKRRQGGG